MLTMAMTPGSESSIIWIIRIDMDGSYMYFSTEYDKLTLDGIDFDGKVIDYPGDMEEGVVGNAVDGGNIGIVSNFTFSIKRYTDYSGASNFINDFYPATSKPLLTAKTVDVGITWRGATTLSQITWLKQYYIQDPKFLRNKIECFCVEFDELAGKQLPYYTIQNDKNNGISYFTDAPEESYGQAIPIIFGDFTTPTTDLIYLSYRATPAIRISQTDNNYIVCSHICETVASPFAWAYRFIEEAKTLMTLTGTTSSVTNTRAGHRISLSTDGTPVLGSIYLPLTKIVNSGYFSFIDRNCVDNDPATCTSVPKTSKLAFQLGYNLSDLGTIVKSSAYVSLRAVVQSANGYNQLAVLGTYYSMVGVDNDPASYLLAPDSDSYATPVQSNIATTIGALLTEEWKTNDLMDRYFTFNGDGANTADIKLYHVYLQITSIKVYDARKYKTVTIPGKKIQIIHLGGFR